MLLSQYPHWRNYIAYGIYQCHGSVLLTAVLLFVISNCMFSLSTLPAHWCSTVFTDVTSLTSSPTLVTLLAKRTYLYISEYYCGYVSLQCHDTDTEALWSPVRTAVLQKKYTGKVIRQTILNYLQYYCLLNLTLRWRWQFWQNLILSVKVLAKTLGVKLLKVIYTEITVF